MCKKLIRVVTCFIAFLILLSPLSCSQANNRGPVIREIIGVSEVPVLFETPFMCKLAGSNSNPMNFNWFSDNGTIKGNGASIVWLAPAEPGIYRIGVRVMDSKGIETTTSVAVNVVEFPNTAADVSPEILLQIPIWGNSSVSVRNAVGPQDTAEINCISPFVTFSQYKYKWSCNGGKIQGTGIKDGTTSKVGWISPGIPGRYTVRVMISNDLGKIHFGCVYFNVVAPSGDACGCR